MHLLLLLLGCSVLSPGSVPKDMTPLALKSLPQSFKERFDAAKGSVERLWDLWLWCEAGEHTREGRQVLRALLELNPEHRPAREALGHEFHEGRWFATKKDLERFVREEEERTAKERGLVRWKDEWVAPEDVPFLERGLVRDGGGGWLTREEQAKRRAGWVRQDLEWIPPEDAPKLAQNLWRCGDQWLPLELADEWHADVERWWRIPGAGFVLYTTCTRDVAARSFAILERMHDDLRRIVGRKPLEAPVVVLLHSPRVYERFGKGLEPPGREPADTRGLVIVHNAFFADRALDPATGAPLDCGVGYWDDSSLAGKRFGQHSLRHAAGLSWIAALEREPRAADDAKRKKKQAAVPTRWPDWFRYGAASYVERWFVDNLTEAGGNPAWARDWAKENLSRRGGPMSLSDFFSFSMAARDPDSAQRWLNQAGLVIAFVLETKIEEVLRAHAAVKEAAAGGQDPSAPLGKLKAAISAHESAFVAHAGL